MSHDPTKVLLGTTQSSDRPGTTVYASDPADFPAGTACRLGSDGLLTLTKGTNQWAGISLGASLSNTTQTCVQRAGSRVPLRLTTEGGTAYVIQGSVVSIDDATGLAAATGLGVTASNAVYVSGVMTGVTEDGGTVSVALVDMIGGL